VVDVEHRSLSALKHDTATVGDDLVEEIAGVGDEGTDLLGGLGVFVEHFGGVDGSAAEQRLGDSVLLLAGGFDVVLKDAGIEQIDDAQTTAGHLVFVGWADAAAGGADFLASGSAFRSKFNHAVIG
jgi:hypothetical protein